MNLTVPVPEDLLPFHTYIIKVASRCNLNCDYCFVYNLADTRWTSQPPLMAFSTFRKICDRIVEHCHIHSKPNVSLVFHGGEPLLGGVDHLRVLLETARSIFSAGRIGVRLGIQSNGLLFHDFIGELLLEHHATIGVSIDGPPRINDIHRVDHRGVGSSRILEGRLKLLASPKFRDVFSGFLIVVNPMADPRNCWIMFFNFVRQRSISCCHTIIGTVDHWASLILNQLFTGEWLVDAFDYWYSLKSTTRVRQFASIMRLALKAAYFVETVGLDPVTLVVIEANGDIEAFRIR